MPRGKTAATIKKSAPLVAHNLVQVIAGRQTDASFDGYTSCPLLKREGAAMLIEFDYEGRLTPSLPMIEPLQARLLRLVDEGTHAQMGCSCLSIRGRHGPRG